ncbi:hypothetical protein HMPREF3217_00693 [Finegoldia magna]|nr:hypothetical protein HMPREF3217_00693 [Finegoldia magna]
MVQEQAELEFVALAKFLVGITNATIMELQYVFQNYNKGNGYVAKTDVK